MLKKILSLLTIFLSLCLTTVDAATPEYTADKAVLAYAELYTFGTSENVAATGMPEETTEELQKLVKNQYTLPFYNYPLNKENFEMVQTKFAEKIREVIKISTLLKVDDAENPVVEVTVNHIDQNAIDELKTKNGNFVTLDIMKHISEPAELISDEKFQNIATASLLDIIDKLPLTKPTTFDVTCKMIEYEGNFYWMPQDLKSLSQFVSPMFELKETNPELIDGFLLQVFGNGIPKDPAEENSTENSTEG